VSRPSATSPPGVAGALASDPWALLVPIAFLCWLLAHLPALAPYAGPAWVLTGLAVGLVRPWYGLLLTIVVVPFLGGAIDQMSAEILRVVPIYGAAVRVLADRFIIVPGLGRRAAHEPAWWAVAAAVAAAGLYALTALTAYLDGGRDPVLLDGALRWVAGGSAAMMAAWVAASHLVAGRDRTLTLVILGTTAVACTLAIAAWLGAPGLDLVLFPARVQGGRLGALGYPTPTAMGLAIVLPLAAWAAYGIRRWLSIIAVGLVLATIALTWSRGPLIAVGIGGACAALASGRVDRRLAVAGLATGLVAAFTLVVLRYGTDPAGIIASLGGVSTSDLNRVGTWVAAVAIVASSPVIGGGWQSLSRIPEFAAQRVVYSHSTLLFAFADGGLPLGIANATVILYSAWRTWVGRHTMAVYLIASVVTFLVCGLWDIPQVRSYAAVMGGIVLGMASGPLIGRQDAASEAGVATSA
jgi:hypothetical protein